MVEKQQYFVVGKIKAGDTGAYRNLFRKFYPSVMAFVEGFVKDRVVAEDIVQEVFVKLWIYRSSLDDTRPIRGYLFLLSRREIVSWFRKEVTVQKMMIGAPREELDRIADAGDGRVEAEELQRMADEIVSGMPEKRRQVFLLSRRDGLSVKDIAARLDISPRTVNKHMQLALRTLRENMDKI